MKLFELGVARSQRYVDHIGDWEDFDSVQLDAKRLHILQVFLQLEPGFERGNRQRTRRQHRHVRLGVTLIHQIVPKSIEKRSERIGEIRDQGVRIHCLAPSVTTLHYFSYSSAAAEGS